MGSHCGRSPNEEIGAKSTSFACGDAGNLFYMLTRAQKEKLVKDLTEKIKDAKVAVFSDFSGTSVTDMQKLRRKLRESGASYKVAKKKIIELAFKEAGIAIDVKNLEGQVGVAIGGADEVTAPKILKKFSRENKNFQVLQGVLENEVIPAEKVSNLADIPGREELLGQLVGTVNAPISGFVNVLAGNLRNLVGVLKAIGEAK